MAVRIFKDFSQLIQEQKMPRGQQKVLLASLKLFSEQGYSNTTTAQISQVSGMSEATIFKYYKTKEQLLLAIITPIITNLFPLWIQDFSSNITTNFTNLKELVHFIVTDRFAFLVQNKEASLILFSELMGNPMVTELFHDTLLTKLKPYAPKLLSAFQSLNEFDRRNSLTDIVRVFTGQLGINFLQCYKFNVLTAKEAQEKLLLIEKQVYQSLSKSEY